MTPPVVVESSYGAKWKHWRKPQSYSKDSCLKNRQNAHFGHTCAKIGTIQRPLAWPLCKDNMRILETAYMFHNKK